MSAPERVLLADDEAISREFLTDALLMLGLEVHPVRDGGEAIEALRSDECFDYVFTDLQMPVASGQEVLEEAKNRDPDRPVVLVTAHGTVGVAVQAMRRGADDILEKPVTTDELELALLRLREKVRLRKENRFFRDRSIAPGHDLVASSPQMRGLMQSVDRVAPSPATVLISGESGTGKERVASLVHQRSDRVERPFIKINCAAIPENLMESELFGHEVGAFTGATRRREGCFEMADGGTLFLDEVGEMALALQPKLLRVLQEGELTRVGGSRPFSVDVRVVAATNRDLAAEVAAGRFREDLFYRLNVVPIEVPPLRDRRDEILEMARVFLPDGVRLEADAEQALLEHTWPGNVRELQNLMQRAGILCEEGLVRADSLREWLGQVAGAGTIIPRPSTAVVGDLLQGRSLRELESAAIREAMLRCGGNRTQAAKLLGIGVRTLFNKLKSMAEHPALGPA